MLCLCVYFLFYVSLTFLFNKKRRCFSALMIAKQPFPKSIKQNIKTSTAVDDPVVVRLFAPAKIEVCACECVYVCIGLYLRVRCVRVCACARVRACAYAYVCAYVYAWACISQPHPGLCAPHCVRVMCVHDSVCFVYFMCVCGRYLDTPGF